MRFIICILVALGLATSIAASADAHVPQGGKPRTGGAGVSVLTHVADARRTTPAAYTMPGQPEKPATDDGSPARTVIAFAGQGVLHILDGIDHVFLVVCLALGIGARKRLVWIVTAFTLGHSATLIATFLGATPAWPWFIPAVETAIAATVFYAAAAAYLRKMDSIAVIAGVGLLHGLGFSFVLGDILGRDSPDLIPALAAFNIGIEIGQLIVIAATLAAVAVVTRLSDTATPVLRNAALAGIATMSAWWVIERSADLLA
ncbi:MAG: HupE/UreJ family protein [Oricola sp.]